MQTSEGIDNAISKIEKVLSELNYNKIPESKKDAIRKRLEATGQCSITMKITNHKFNYIFEIAGFRLKTLKIYSGNNEGDYNDLAAIISNRFSETFNKTIKCTVRKDSDGIFKAIVKLKFS